MKAKFLILGLVFMIFLSSTISGIDRFERTFIEPGYIYRIELNQSNLALSHNYFSVRNAVKWAKITTQRITETSVPVPLEGAYAYFRITTEGMTNYELKNAELEFRVKRKWLDDMGKSTDLVSLHFFNEYGADWSELGAEYQGSHDGEAFFKTNTENYGYFAITAEPKPIEPGFEDVIEEPGEVKLAPPKKTFKELIQSIPKYVYILVISLVLVSAIGSGVYSFVFKLHHPYPELTKYIKSSIHKGGELSEIKSVLCGAGWPKDIVLKELEYFEEKIPEANIQEEVMEK